MFVSAFDGDHVIAGNGGLLGRECAALLAGDHGTGLCLSGVLLQEGEIAPPGAPVLGRYADVARVALEHGVSRIVVASGERLRRWDIGMPCWSIALSPDGLHVAAARQDGVTLILPMPGPPAGYFDGGPAGRKTK